MPAPLLVVPRAVVGIVEGRVDRTDQSHGLAYRHPGQKPVHQPLGPIRAEQGVKGALKRVVVRNFPHADPLAPIIAVPQQRLDVAITLFLVLPDDQAGEQLWQREVLAAELVVVAPHAGLSQSVRVPHHLPWRFAG